MGGERRTGRRRQDSRNERDEILLLLVTLYLSFDDVTDVHHCREEENNCLFYIFCDPPSTKYECTVCQAVTTISGCQFKILLTLPTTLCHTLVPTCHSKGPAEAQGTLLGASLFQFHTTHSHYLTDQVDLVSVQILIPQVLEGYEGGEI